MTFLRRLFPYIKRYRRDYALGLALVLTSTVLAAAAPWIIKAAIDRLEAADPRGAGALALALIGAGLGRALLSFLGRYMLVRASRGIEYDLRGDLYAKIMRLPAAFFDRASTGDVASRVLNDVEGVRMVAGVSVMMVASSGLLFLFSLGAMLALDARLTGLALIPLVLVSAITALLTGRIYRESERVQDRLSDLSAVAQENFSGARVVRAFAQEESQNRRFGESSRSYWKANMDLAATRGAAWGMMTLLTQLTIAVIFVAGGLGLVREDLTLGRFTAFVAYQFMLSWPVIAMGWVITLIQRGAACMNRIAELLDAPEEEEPPEGPAPKAGAIEIRGLTFRYGEDREPALDGLSLKIAAGERVAVVGRTGSGKSTLIQVLLGLYRVPRGTVLIDGRDINDYPRRALRNVIGGVPQDTFLFSDRLSANIAFGARDGDGHEAAVLAAAEDSRILEDASGFPHGIHQVIGERGITLSGGQKQRTAIARALIRRPSLLLLDDALSSVDVHTEKDILERLDRFMEGRTSILVTHRFSAVAKVDRIVVLDRGRVAEEGTHRELMRRKGLYAELAARQRLEEALQG